MAALAGWPSTNSLIGTQRNNRQRKQDKIMGLRTFTPAPKGNKYSADVNTLLDATNANQDPANVPAWDLEVSTAKVDYERGEFQRAANFINKTAKVVAESVDGDNTTVTFILVDKYKGKSKDKSATEVVAENAPEVSTAQDSAVVQAVDAADVIENQTRPKPRR